MSEVPVSKLDFPIVAAFATIYIVWGSTYVAIRMLVESVPPLLSAGLRFFVAGVLLYLFAILRGYARPTALQWRNIAAVSLSMFVLTYGALFWAEKSVPSGIASVIAAMVPILTVVLEVWVFRTQPFQTRLMLAALVGFIGVGVLLWPGTSQHAPFWPCLAVLAGTAGWAFGSVLSRSVSLPASRLVTAGAEMLAGGAGLLLWSLAAGELADPVHFSQQAAWSLFYLITAGSLLGFTAFVFLLGRMPASRISSYAYVNPVVAVLLGYFLAGETLSWRTALGATLVLASVVLTIQRKAILEPVTTGVQTAPAYSAGRLSRLLRKNQ